MKNTALALLVALLHAIPSLASATLASEVCARTPAEMTASADIHAAALTFGKPSQLFTTWKLAGFAGVISRVVVHLTATQDALSVQVNEDDPNDFWFCVSADQPDVLKMRVQNPRKPENSLILIKAREPGETAWVASQKSNWKFMKFKHED